MYASQQFVIIGKRCLEEGKTAFLIAQNGRAIGWKDACELPDEKISAYVWPTACGATEHCAADTLVEDLLVL